MIVVTNMYSPRSAWAEARAKEKSGSERMTYVTTANNANEPTPPPWLASSPLQRSFLHPPDELTSSEIHNLKSRI